jgi:ankyrin repeat protein
MPNSNQLALSRSIHTACAKGDRSSISRALRQGAHIDAPNSNKHTPLFAAIISADYELAHFLMDMGADPSKGCLQISCISLIENHLAISNSYLNEAYNKPLAALSARAGVFAERAALSSQITRPANAAPRLKSL